MAASFCLAASFLAAASFLGVASCPAVASPVEASFLVEVSSPVAASLVEEVSCPVGALPEEAFAAAFPENVLLVSFPEMKLLVARHAMQIQWSFPRFDSPEVLWDAHLAAHLPMRFGFPLLQHLEVLQPMHIRAPLTTSSEIPRGPVPLRVCYPAPNFQETGYPRFLKAPEIHMEKRTLH